MKPLHILVAELTEAVSKLTERFNIIEQEVKNIKLDTSYMLGDYVEPEFDNKTIQPEILKMYTNILEEVSEKLNQKAIEMAETVAQAKGIVLQSEEETSTE